MLPDRTREYLLISLHGSPLLLRQLVGSVPADDPRWDRGIDGRFTPREVVAHLADWESIFLARLRQTATEETPDLLKADEGVLAEEHNYAGSDPRAEADRFVSERATTLQYVASLPADAWERVGVHAKIGPMSIEVHAVQMLVHDGFHLEYLSRLLA